MADKDPKDHKGQQSSEYRPEGERVKHKPSK